jgi:hypothetical protein
MRNRRCKAPFATLLSLHRTGIGSSRRGCRDASWVAALPRGKVTASADALPDQGKATADLVPLRWYESVWLQLVLMMLLVIAFASYPVIAGRHLPWLLLQLVAFAAVAMGVSWWRARGERGGRAGGALLLAGGVVFIPWALYWGLLVPLRDSVPREGWPAILVCSQASAASPCARWKVRTCGMFSGGGCRDVWMK